MWRPFTQRSVRTAGLVRRRPTVEQLPYCACSIRRWRSGRPRPRATRWPCWPWTRCRWKRFCRNHRPTNRRTFAGPSHRRWEGPVYRTREPWARRTRWFPTGRAAQQRFSRPADRVWAWTFFSAYRVLYDIWNTQRININIIILWLSIRTRNYNSGPDGKSETNRKTTLKY